MALTAPKRSELLKHYEAADLYGRIWYFVDLAILALAAWNFRPEAVRREPLEALILVGVSVGPTLLSLAYLFARKAKRVEDLRETATFGEITKQILREQIAEVLRKMKIKPSDVNIYVTADKQVNASALALGLGKIVPSLRRVYLNRATLHALSKDELSTVIAHELAHLYRFPLRYQKALFFHMTTACLASLSVWSHGAHPMLAITVIAAYYFCLNFIFGRYSRTVEHLCDDCGAEIGGIDPALRAEFRVSQHAEIVSRALRVALERKLSGQGISAKQIQDVIDDSLTFDPPKAEDLEREVLSRMQTREEQQNTSFAHFAKGLFFTETLDVRSRLQEQLDNLKLAHKTPALELPPGDGFSREWFAELVRRMKAEPEKVLFRVPEELSDADSTHPSPRRRILYLWENFISSPS